MEKVIFLDIDGVLATTEEFYMSRNYRDYNSTARRLSIPYPFNQGCVQIFNEILEKTGAEIVLSSDWRLYWDIGDLDEIFKFNLVSKSPKTCTLRNKRKLSSSHEDDRSWQISQYLEKHSGKIKSWVAIDDLRLLGLNENFVLTNINEGLKEIGIKERIIDILNKND